MRPNFSKAITSTRHCKKRLQICRESEIVEMGWQRLEVKEGICIAHATKQVLGIDRIYLDIIRHHQIIESL